MPDDRQRRIDALYLQARDSTPAERAALFARADADLRRIVEDRLAREAPDATPEDPTVTTPAGAAPAGNLLAPGAELGDYRIESPLGAGGMGEVSTHLSTRRATHAGLLLGTPPYMSPEQVRSGSADHRSDLWALGCVLFELLSGVRAFRGETITGTLAAILEHDPDWTALPARTLPRVRSLLKRLLDKDPDRRYQSAGAVRAELAACRARLVSPGVRGHLRKPAVAVPALAVLLALASGAAWLIYQSQQRSWARDVALPEISRLLEAENTDAAFRLGRQAERHIPGDPRLLDLRRHYAARVPIESTPPGADVYLKGYLNDDAEWLHVGRTPLADVAVPAGYLRWRVAMDGFAPVERAAYSIGPVQFTLHPESERPAGMAFVPGGPFAFRGFPQVRLEDFWLDTFEVTNRQFKRFVDAGGYTNPEYWTEPFVKEGAIVSWEDAVAALRDAPARRRPIASTNRSCRENQMPFMLAVGVVQKSAPAG
jgi:hypothetical protein